MALFVWTPFDLLTALASSATARAAERSALRETLQSLHDALTEFSAGRDVETAKAMFSNAASSLFCQSRLLTSTPAGFYEGIPPLALQVEDALLYLQRGSLTAHQAIQLIELLATEISKLQ